MHVRLVGLCWSGLGQNGWACSIRRRTVFANGSELLLVGWLVYDEKMAIETAGWSGSTAGFDKN